MTFKTAVSAIALTAVSFGAVSVGAFAAEDRGPLSSYRHNLFELVKYSSLSVLYGLQGKVATPEGHYAHHADILNQAATMAREALQTDGRSEEGRSDAKPEIWENLDDFNAKMDKFVADTAALKAAAEAGDKAQIGAATKAVFSNCKGCHDKYREEH